MFVCRVTFLSHSYNDTHYEIKLQVLYVIILKMFLLKSLCKVAVSISATFI